MDAEEDDIGPIAARLSYQLRRLDITAIEQLYARMIEIGVPPGRGTALVYVDLHPGCDQATLGRSLGINPAGTMAAVNALVGLGAVERRPGRDRRSNALHLTDKGHRLVADLNRSPPITMHRFSQRSARPSARTCPACWKVRAANSAIAPPDTTTRRANLGRVKWRDCC